MSPSKRTNLLLDEAKKAGMVNLITSDGMPSAEMIQDAIHDADADAYQNGWFDRDQEVMKEIEALRQQNAGLREALSAITRRVPIMTSRGDYRAGQEHALAACREDATKALAQTADLAGMPKENQQYLNGQVLINATELVELRRDRERLEDSLCSAIGKIKNLVWCQERPKCIGGDIEADTIAESAVKEYRSAISTARQPKDAT